ncbi:hypothetical protein [Fischerella sp. PCC 9605]|nr:hypothetical protein [Fischerella sp. PCC 9605]
MTFKKITDTTLAEAIAQYLREKLPKREFLAWVAEVMNIYTTPI